jgi:GcrA cell cycle regulator
MATRESRLPHSAALKAKFAALWATGASAAAIGRQLGLSKNACVGLRLRMGLPPRPSPIGVVPRKPRPRPRPAAVAKARAPGRCEPWPLAVPTAGFRTCQFPTTGARPWRFCEAALAPGQAVYCAAHQARCTVVHQPRVPDWRRYP